MGEWFRFDEVTILDIVMLCILVVAVVIFVVAGRIAGENGRLFVIVKVAAGIVAVGCFITVAISRSL